MKKGSNMMTSLSLLYFLFVLMLFQLSFLMYKKDNQSIFVFAIIIFITYLVNPNMIFVLGVSLVSINLLMYMRSNVTFEGMENQGEIVKRDCRDFKNHIYERINDADVSGNIIPSIAKSFCDKVKKNYLDAETDYDFYDFYIKQFNNITDKPSIEWINKNIYNSDNFSYIICNKGNSDRNMPEHIEKGLKNINKPIESFSNDDHTENMIHEDKSDPNHISNVMERLQKTTPELVGSLEMLKTLDMNQVNALINNLNSLASTFKGKN
jgi:hypothetical protein